MSRWRAYEFPDRLTIGDKYGPGMEITDPDEAREYFEACVRHAMRRDADLCWADAYAQERANLGYFAGYYSRETADRVARLFGAIHPVVQGHGLGR